MTREEFANVSAEILANLADTGKVSELLDSLRNAFNDTLTESETNAKTAAELTEKNESLQAANMQLFLKTGVQEKLSAETETETETETPDFDSLFDENGELK